MQGGRVMDWIPDRFKPREKAPKRFTDFLDNEGSKQVIDIKVGRKPVNSGIQKALNLASFGGFNHVKRKLKYDDVYHNYLIVTMSDGQKYKVEKNHVVSKEKADKDDEKDSYQVGLPVDRNITLKELINNASSGNEKRFYQYDPSSDNCQKFVEDVVTKNNLTVPDLKTAEVIEPQKAQSLIDSLGALDKVPKLITDVAGAVDHAYYGAGAHIYSADRRVSQCKGVNRNGRRCKNKTAKTEYCYTHLRKEKGLRIGKSKIRGAKEGLFATKNFRRNENVAEYTGQILTRAEKEASNSHYIFEPKRGVYIDARLTNEQPGRWANDCRAHNKRARECNGNNTKFSYDTRNRKTHLKATKNIKKGDEIFVSYGPAFWGR